MHIYDLPNVIAIIEVKKNLYSSELISAYNNLLSPYSDVRAEKEYWSDYLKESFKLLTHKHLYSLFTQDFNHLTTNEQYLAFSLDHDNQLPVRIIFGYDGFASEHSLRESFLDHLENVSKSEDVNRTKGYAPYNFPNLIMCGDNCLLKLNGMPYAMVFEGELPHVVPDTDRQDWLPVYGSSSKNNVIVFGSSWIPGS